MNVAVLRWGAVDVRFKSDAFRAADVLHAIEMAERTYPRLLEEVTDDVFVSLTKVGEHSVGAIVKDENLIYAQLETGDNPLPKIFKRLGSHIKRNPNEIR